MQVISFYNQKGGTGKSTICCEVAFTLSKNKKVLLIDLDSQCNSTALLCGKIPERGIFDLLSEEELPSVYQYLTPGQGAWGAVVVLASSKRLDTALPLLQNRMNRDFILRNIIKSVEDHFDYVLIDYPPQLNLLTINGLTASTGYVIVQQPEGWSLDGAKTVHDLAEKVKRNLNPDLKCLGVLVNLVKKENSSFVRSMLEEIDGVWGDKLFTSRIPDSVVVGEAKKKNLPVQIHAPNHKVTAQLSSFIEEVKTSSGG